MEAFIASLPAVETPTMARAKHAKWSRRKMPPKPHEAESSAAE
jgi:hypothetical protein